MASFAAAGCGGGGDSTAATLTKAQFLRQADAICAKTEERQLARMQGFNEPPGRASEIKLVRVAGLPPLHVQAEELGTLTPPAEMDRQVDVFLAAFETGIEEIEKAPIKLLNIERNPFTESQKLAKALGLKVCGGA